MSVPERTKREYRVTALLLRGRLVDHDPGDPSCFSEGKCFTIFTYWRLSGNMTPAHLFTDHSKCVKQLLPLWTSIKRIVNSTLAWLQLGAAVSYCCNLNWWERNKALWFSKDGGINFKNNSVFHLWFLLLRHFPKDYTLGPRTNNSPWL